MTRPTVFAVTLVVHAATHPACDHIVQTSRDAHDKGLPGWTGRRACARHVASYTAVQAGTLAAVARVLGLRLPGRALAAGAAVTAVTHYVIDRRAPLRRLLHALGKQGYLEHATVQRRPGVVDAAGPGTAWTECDQAMHHVCALVAALTTAVLTHRPPRR